MGTWARSAGRLVRAYGLAYVHGLRGRGLPPGRRDGRPLPLHASVGRSPRGGRCAPAAYFFFIPPLFSKNSLASFTFVANKLDPPLSG